MEMCRHRSHSGFESESIRADLRWFVDLGAKDPWLDRVCRFVISKVISRGFSTGSIRFADGCHRSVGAALGWIHSKYAKRRLQGD